MCRYLQQQAKYRPDSEVAALFKGRIHRTGYACKERCYDLWHELPAANTYTMKFKFVSIIWNLYISQPFWPYTLRFDIWLS